MSAQNTVTSSGTQIAINFAIVVPSGFLKGKTQQLQQVIRMAFQQAGQAADQVDGLIAEVLTMVASTPQTIDLTTATDVNGNAVTVARVRFLLLLWESTTDNVPLLVGAAASDEWDGFLSSGAKISVFPSSPNNDGALILTAPQTTGIPVTSTSKALKIDPQTAAGTAILIAATCSA